MLGFEVSPIVQYVVAFAIIAILLALFAIVLKRIGGNRFAMSGGERGRGRQPRLGIVDVYDLDRQRQLVLLRRDNVEHLVMLGGANDFVVESNIVRMPAARAMAPQAPMQPGQTPHAVAPVAGLEAGHDRAQAPEVDYAPQPVMPAQPIPPQKPASLQGTPAQGASQAAPDVASGIAPAHPAPEPHQPVPGAGTAPTGYAAEDRGVEDRGEAAPPVSPGQDASRQTPRPEEPPQPQKRGLFGFARPSGHKPGGQENDKPGDRRDVASATGAPQFPPRSRATPVAPPTPSPYPPRRTSETTQPEADVTAGLAAALATGGGAAAAAAARSGSGEVTAAASVPPQEPSQEIAGSQEAAGSAPDLQQALFSDMERELEAAFQRQAAAEPVPKAPAQPDVQTPPEAPAFPTRMAPAVPEPVISEPAETDMPPEGTQPGAEAGRATHAHGPAPGMTPPPSTGPAYFAPVVDEAMPAHEERQAVDQEEPQEEHRGPGFPGEEVPAPQAAPAPPSSPDEAPAGDSAGEEAFGQVIGADEAANKVPPMEQPHLEEPRFDASSAEASSQDSAASEEAVWMQSPPATDAEPAQDQPEEMPAPASEDAIQETREDSHEPPSEEPPQTPDETGAKVDPFSVDEIEAEFARLLGRSVDKNPKSS